MRKDKKEEYDHIYEKHKGSGFSLTYRNKRLGKSRVIFRDVVANIETTKRNGDTTPLVVVCGSCDIYMDFEAGRSGILDGRWACRLCGAKVKERTVYTKLDSENQVYDDVDTLPDICKECDGPWPECQSGCRLLRD